MTNPNTPEVVLNQITSDDNKRLVKRWRVGEDGPVKEDGGALTRGTIETKRVRLAVLAAIVTNAGPDECLVSSTVEHPLGTEIMARWVRAGYIDIVGIESAGDIVTRTEGDMTYEAGVPGMFVVDFDFSKYCPYKYESPRKLLDMLVREMPEVFKGAACVGYFSSSSYIYKGEEQVTGPRGIHLIFAVEDSSNIPALRDYIFDRLWLAGYGYIALSGAGTALVRSPLDKAVIQPQQPIFTSVQCDDGLKQHRPEPIIRGGGYVNIPPPLTSEQKAEVDRMIAEAKKAAKPEMDKVRAEYLKTQIKKLVGRGISKQQAKRTVESRIGGVLTGSDVLHFDKEGDVPVAEVLADPMKYDKKTLADPREPDYGGGRGKAILFANDGSPIVYSHAHGGQVFQLRHDLDSAMGALESMDNPNEGWIDLALSAQWRDDEEEAFLVEVKNKTDRTLGVLRKTLSRARNERDGGYADASDMISDILLREEYQGGKHLLRTTDRSFWRYTGTHWVRMEDEILKSQLQAIAKDNWSQVKAMKSVVLADVVNRAFEVLGRRVVRDGDPLHLKASPPAVINCMNGELWLTEDGPELRRHRPDSFLTSCTGIKYDPDAKAPTYDNLLNGIFNDTEVSRHVTEMLGYAVQPSRFLKVFYMFLGGGDNGKTKLMNLYKRIVGIDGAYWGALKGIEKDQHRTMHLLGKLAAVDDDAEKGLLLPDGFLKAISEEKPMTGRLLYKNLTEFISHVVPIILSNHFPATRDLSHGMRTRAQVVKFPRKFLKLGDIDADGRTVDEDHPDVQRPDLWDEVFASEMPGVLNQWIDGYYRLKKRGAFNVPDACQEAAEEWLANANPVSQFMADMFKPGSSDDRILISKLYDLYTLWADAEGGQTRYVAKLSGFRDFLKSLGLTVKRSSRAWELHGRRMSMNAAMELRRRSHSHRSINTSDLDKALKALGWRDLIGDGTVVDFPNVPRGRV